MQTIDPFAWKRLTALSLVEHSVDRTSGALKLRGSDPKTCPFTMARVRDGRGGFVTRTIADLGLRWLPADNGDGWILRTIGAPVTMATIDERWLPLIRETTSDVDERLIATTIACEVGRAAPDAEGFVKAPRTEKDYPRRAGEHDPGDLDRDLEDWENYVAHRPKSTAHSSHGLMQTLISTAVGARPDLFADVSPRDYRKVLWDPAKALACGVAYLRSFPARESADPLASRIRYGRGYVEPSAANVWGAVVYDDLVPLHFVAYWNDEACLRAGACDVPVDVDPWSVAPEDVPPAPHPRAWLFAATAMLLLTAMACLSVAWDPERS